MEIFYRENKSRKHFEVLTKKNSDSQIVKTIEKVPPTTDLIEPIRVSNFITYIMHDDSKLYYFGDLHYSHKMRDCGFEVEPRYIVDENGNIVESTRYRNVVDAVKQLKRTQKERGSYLYVGDDLLLLDGTKTKIHHRFADTTTPLLNPIIQRTKVTFNDTIYTVVHERYGTIYHITTDDSGTETLRSEKNPELIKAYQNQKIQIVK